MGGITWFSALLLGAAPWLTGLASTYAAETPGVVTVPAGKPTLHVAVSLPAGVLNGLPGLLKLTEIDHPEVVVPAQRIPAMAADGTITEGKSCLAASIPPRKGSSQDRRFRVEPAPAAEKPAGFRFRELNDKSLLLQDGGKPVLVYNFGVVTDPTVPKNDARGSRACFVHPLYGLNGEVLTDSFPKDHYHHHGLFWAWPHIFIEGKEYDLWVDKDIRQRFVRWICREAGPVAAVLAVENGWFVGDTKVMIERVWLRVFRPSDGERSIDVEFALIPVGKPITLRGAEGKSYGGLNLRFAPRKDTLITVPSGPTKEDLPDTPLPWVDLTAKFAGAPGPSGAAIFVDPKQLDFPPHWLTRHYGILCCGWPGVKGATLAPGVPVRLDYRVWIHKTAVEAADLQRAYDGYATGKYAVGRGQRAEGRGQ